MPRTLIAPRGDKRFVRRKRGKFTSKQVNVGRSLAADRAVNRRPSRKRVRATEVINVAERLNVRQRAKSGKPTVRFPFQYCAWLDEDHQRRASIATPA